MAKEKKKLVVIVEDEQTLLNLIELGLKEAGYSVKTATDGKKGLELIKKSKPDVLLLDVMLPGLGGFDILEVLNEEKILPKLPVIVISNSGQPVEIERARNLGIRDYLIKVNFNPHEVVAKVDRLFETKRDTKSSGRKERGVLIIEDDSILSESLRRKFVQKNYDTFTAFNIGEAKRLLKDSENNISIILLDLILPDEDGFAYLRELKSNKRLKEIPVVIISNLGQKEEIDKGLSSGAEDYIVKANTIPGEIFEKVDRLLTKGQKR